MDELIDLLDPNGTPTGKTAMKSEAHKNGWFHPTVHIWFFTTNGQLLLQQRGKNKTMHPLIWDVSVAGHIAAGETIQQGALREIEEEIGLNIPLSDLHKIGVFKSIQKHGDDIIDCEFHHTFIAPLKAAFKTLQKQDSEVEAIELVPLSKFSEEIRSKATLKKYVPHGLDYYQAIISAVEERL